MFQLLGIAQSCVVHVAASYGLGQHQDTLSEGYFTIYAKNEYYGNILFLLAIYCAKLSLMLLTMRLAAANKILQACRGFIVMLTLWALGCMVALALQCDLPSLWDYRTTNEHTCAISRAGFWYSIAVGDIISDLVVFGLPTIVVYKVQISASSRWALLCAFGSRLAVVICSIIRVTLLPAYFASSDASWAGVPQQMALQIAQCLSIITTCIPSLEQFFGAFDSGFMDISMRKRTGTTYRTGNRSQTDSFRGATGQGNASFAMHSLTSQGKSHDTVKVVVNGDSRIGHGQDSESTKGLRDWSSEDGLDLDGITVTREVLVA